MHIISKRALREFWEKNPNSKASLQSWFSNTKLANWSSFTEVRETFRHADIYSDCVVFDIGGNNFRLVTKIRYRRKRIYIRAVLFHKDYDKNLWKDDCEC
jgi:mRNA interferase HigB